MTPTSSGSSLNPTQVVPTEHNSRRGKVTETHQYSVSEYALPVAKETAGSVLEVSWGCRHDAPPFSFHCNIGVWLLFNKIFGSNLLHRITGLPI